MPQRIHIQIHKSKQQSNIEVSKASTTPPTILNHNLGLKNYELSNHLGNVTTVISDRKIPRSILGTNINFYMPDIVSATDYYPFGMTMQERSFSAGGAGYRYGFNGKENDAESNTQDYGMRIYDGRLGRFLSVDPLTAKYPFYTPFQFAGNMPIKFIDLDGCEPANPGKKDGQYEVAPLKGTEETFEWTWNSKGVNGSKGFWNQGCPTTFTKGNATLNSKDDDLTKTAHAGVDAFTVCPDKSEMCNAENFNASFTSGISLEGEKAQNEANGLRGKFLTGTSGPKQFFNDSKMAAFIRKDSQFNLVANKFELGAINYYNAHGNLEGFNPNQLLSNPYIKDTWFMHTVMGGTCQFTAQITKLTSTQIAVQYTLYDHFGAGTKDAVSALPGLPSLYCIQRIPGTKYVPFIWSVTLKR